MFALCHRNSDDVLAIELTDWDCKTSVHLIQDSVGGNGSEGWGQEKTSRSWVVVCVGALLLSVVLAVLLAVLTLLSVLALLSVVARLWLLLTLLSVVTRLWLLALGLLAERLSSTGVDQDSTLSNAQPDVGVLARAHVLGNGLKSDWVDCDVLDGYGTGATECTYWAIERPLPCG